VTDGKRELMHVLTRHYRALGLSFTTALGLAIAEIERGAYDWQTAFPPSSADVRILERHGLTR